MVFSSARFFLYCFGLDECDPRDHPSSASPMSVSSEPLRAGNSQSRRAKFRTLTAKLVIVGVTTAICIAILEVAVRALFPYFRPSAQIPFIPQPGGFALGPPLQTTRQATPKGDYDLLIRFNEDGFRDTKN